MTRKKKIVAFLMAAMMLMSTAPMKTQAAAGWSYENGNWYYYNTDGSLATGWLLLDDCWYYLESDGRMRASAWVASTETDWYWLGGSGIMQSNYWVEENGNRYYLKENGLMAHGEDVVINGMKYTFADSGVLIGEEEFTGNDGWVEENGQYYYYKNGEKQKGWQVINGKTYYLGGSDYRMFYGINVIDGVTYEFTNNGQLIGRVENNYEDEYDPDDYASEKELLAEAINDKRADENLDDLGWVEEDGLDMAAFIRANELHDEYSDERPDGTSVEDLLDDLDVEYEYVEEYYFRASSIARAMVEITSDRALYRAITDENFDTLAIGVADDGNTYIWEILLVEGGEMADSSNNGADADQQDIVDYINDYRWDADRDELEFDSYLSDAAEEWAYQIATGSDDYEDLDDLLWDFDVDYDSYANVVTASRVEDFYDMVDEWYDSTSSRNILNNRNAYSIGVGIYEHRSRTYVAVIVTDGEGSSSNTSASISRMKNDLLELINDYRWDEDLDELDLASGEWTDAADDRADELAYYEGDEDELEPLDDFMEYYDVNYRSSSTYELYAYMCDDADEAFDEIYYNDRYDDLLNSRCRNVAIGIVEDGGEYYWSVLLYR